MFARKERGKLKTKEQMKKTLFNKIELLWRKVEQSNNLIKLYENEKELTENQTKLLNYEKEDKHENIRIIIALEETFEELFNINYYDYRKEI